MFHIWLLQTHIQDLVRNVRQHKMLTSKNSEISDVSSPHYTILFISPCRVLPIADDKVCISCYNPVVVSCYDQHLPGINNRTCTGTNMPPSDKACVKFMFGLCYPQPWITVLSVHSLQLETPWLTQSVVVCSRWVREGRLRRGACTSETLCLDRAGPRVKGGAGSCTGWAQLLGRDGWWAEKPHSSQVSTHAACYLRTTRKHLWVIFCTVFLPGGGK